MAKLKSVDWRVIALNATLTSAAFASPAISQDVMRILIDPRDSKVLYIATRNDGKAPAYGVFKTTDRGQSWFAINGGLDPNPVVTALSMDPGDPDTLYVGIGKDIYKSIDGGDSWTPTAPSGVYNFHDIAIDPLNSNTIFVGGDGFFSYSKSTDGGASWLPSSGIGHVLSLAIDPTDSDNVYAGVFAGVVGGLVFKTVDGGEHWSRASVGLPDNPVYVVAVDPQNPQIVYAGTSTYGLFKSTDGAARWNVSLTGPLMSAHCLAVDPVDSNVLYACTYEATSNPNRIYKTSDGGETWYEADSGIVIDRFTWFASLAIDPQDSNIIYVATNRGIFRSTDAGDSWSAIGP